MKTGKTYKKGYLPVGDGHEIFYECYGNPKGKTILFFHGGPGAGYGKKEKQLFNTKKFNVIFFNQRGAGKSKPKGETKNNNTQKLVQDTKKLLDYLGHKKAFLFGGSWGSTLALCYAIKHPKTVSGMMLRGIFLADSNDLNYFTDGPVKEMKPQATERLSKIVPKKQRKNPIKYYAKQMQSKNKKTSKKFAYEMAYYETSISHLKITDKEIQKKLKRWGYASWSKIETHYIANKCFLPEKYILKNAKKLSKIPTTIIHGTYDLVCSPKQALLLHKKIKNSKLYYTTGGHAATDKETKQKLLEELKKLRRKNEN